MATTLVLMRHGKAKTLVEGQIDFDRELTEAGRRSLAATLNYELSFLAVDGEPVQVWASPSLRTVQTADLLVDALDLHVEVDLLVLAADQVAVEVHVEIVEGLAAGQRHIGVEGVHVVGMCGQIQARGPQCLGAVA